MPCNHLSTAIQHSQSVQRLQRAQPISTMSTTFTANQCNVYNIHRLPVSTYFFTNSVASYNTDDTARRHRYALQQRQQWSLFITGLIKPQPLLCRLQVYQSCPAVLVTDSLTHCQSGVLQKPATTHTSSVPPALSSSVRMDVLIHLWTAVEPLGRVWRICQGTGTADLANRITPGSRPLNPI